MGLKMPEGPHNRISMKKLKKIFKKHNFKIIDKGNRLLIPKKVPIIHNLNKIFHKIPIVKQAGLIEYIVAIKQ